MESLNAKLEYLSISDIKGEDVFRKTRKEPFYEICIFGRTLSGNTRCIHVCDFKPYAYIGYYAPTAALREVMLRVVNKVVIPRLEQLPWAGGGGGGNGGNNRPSPKYGPLTDQAFSAKLGRKVLGKQMKMGFDSNEENSVFWRLDFNTKRDQSEFQRRFRSAFRSCFNSYSIDVFAALADLEEDIKQIPDERKHFRRTQQELIDSLCAQLEAADAPSDICVNLFHSVMSPDILFTHEKDIQPSGWIAYPKSALHETSTEFLDYSTCDEDIEVPMSKLLAVNDNKYLNEFAVLAHIASTDIETEGLYAVRATVHMVDPMRGLLVAARKLRKQFLQTLGRRRSTPKEVYRQFALLMSRLFMHFFGYKVDPEFVQLVRSDVYLDGNEQPVNEDNMRLFLVRDVEYNWYHELWDYYKTEQTLTESQKVLAQNREKELREIQLSFKLMDERAGAVDLFDSGEGQEYFEELLEHGAKIDDDDPTDDDNDSDEDGAGGGAKEEDEEEDDAEEEDDDEDLLSRRQKKKKKKRSGSEVADEDSTDQEEEEEAETGPATARDVRLWLAEMFPQEFTDDVLLLQRDSNFKIARDNDSILRLLFDGRIFKDKTRGAELLAFVVRRFFGLLRADRVFDVTTTICYPHQGWSHRCVSFLLAEKFAYAGSDIRKLPAKYWDSELHWCKDEKELLLKWRDWYVNDADPDMHIGYNTSGFDIPFMYSRARQLRILDQFMQMSRVRNQVCSGKKPFIPFEKRKSLSPEELKRLDEPVLEKKYTKIRNGEKLQEDVPQVGRSCLDMLIFNQKNKNYSCYSLDYTTSMSVTEEVIMYKAVGHELWIQTKKFLGLRVDDFIHLQLKTNFVINNVGPKLRVSRLVEYTEEKVVEEAVVVADKSLWIVAQFPLESTRFDRLLPKHMFSNLSREDFQQHIRPLLHHYPRSMTDATVQQGTERIRSTTTVKEFLAAAASAASSSANGDVDQEEEMQVVEEEDEKQERLLQVSKLKDLVALIQTEQAKYDKKSGMTMTWGFAKDDMDYAAMQKFAKSGALDEFMLLVKYCLRDCELPIIQFSNMGVWNSFREISKLAQVSLNLTLTRGESIRLHSFITNMCRRRRVFMADSYHPFNDDRAKRATTKKLKNYEGAFVIPPITGLYNDSNIIVCDFNSLYPSLILSYVIGHCSKAIRIQVDLEGKVVKTWASTGLERQIKARIKVPGLPPERFLTHDGRDGLKDLHSILEKARTAKCFHDSDRPNVLYFRSAEQDTANKEFVVINQKFPVRANVDPREVEGPNTRRKKLMEKIIGHVYIFYTVERHFMRRELKPDHLKAIYREFHGDRSGDGSSSPLPPPPTDLKQVYKLPIVGSMCDVFLVGRKKAKKNMEAAEEAGNKQAYDIYNAQQGAVKVMNNSVYGSTGNAQGGLFCDFDIASTTTSLGRLYILYSQSLTTSPIFLAPPLSTSSAPARAKKNPRIWINRKPEDTKLVQVPIPTSLREVGNLAEDLAANTRLAHMYEELLASTPFLEQDRIALEMARERFFGLLAVEHTNGFLAFRNAVLEELITKENTSGWMDWTSPICAETGRMLWATHPDPKEKDLLSPQLAHVAELEIVSNPTLYGDTDSIFFNPRYKAFAADGATDITSTLSKEDKMYLERALGESVGQFVTQIAPPPMKLAYEKILFHPLLANRKRYAAVKFENNMKKGKPLVMGLGICRKDTPDYMKTILISMLQHFQNNTPFSLILEEIRGKIEDLVQGRVPVEQLVLSCSIKSHYADPDKIKQVRLAARMTEREPATAPKGGDRVQYLHIVPEGMDMLRDRYKIEPVKIGDRIETPDFVASNGLQIDYFYYIVKSLFSQMMQFFGLAIDLVYACLDRKEEYEKTVVPRLKALEDSCRDEKGDLKAEFNKKKNDLCTKLVTPLLAPILYPDYSKVVRTVTAAKQYAKEHGLPIPVSKAAGSSSRVTPASANPSKPSRRAKGLFPVFGGSGAAKKQQKLESPTASVPTTTISGCSPLETSELFDFRKVVNGVREMYMDDSVAAKTAAGATNDNKKKKKVSVSPATATVQRSKITSYLKSSSSSSSLGPLMTPR